MQLDVSGIEPTLTVSTDHRPKSCLYATYITQVLHGHVVLVLLYSYILRLAKCTYLTIIYVMGYLENLITKSSMFRLGLVDLIVFARLG